MKTYNIEIENEKNETVTLNLKQADGGSVELTAYSVSMNFSEFNEFADSVDELRDKFSVMNEQNKKTA